MKNLSLFDAKIHQTYQLISFSKANDFNPKPFNNIGLYVGKLFTLHDIRYNKQNFFIIIDGVEYALRGCDTKNIFVESVNCDECRL